MPDITQIVTLLAIILISMTLHEAMHAFTGYWLGDNTAKEEGRLTLNPIAHIDPFLTVLLPIILLISGGPIFGGAKPVPFNPSRVRYGELGAMLVGVIGPLTNLLIAFLLFAFVALTGGAVAAEILNLAILVNLGFFIFNMIPIPPLDGSRLLYYLAPDPARRIMVSMEVYGIVVIFAMVLFFGQFFGQYMQAAVSFFVNIFAAIFGVVI